MRFYEIEGRRLPSVTTILQATMPLENQGVLHKSIAKNPQKAIAKRDEARQRGEFIHKWAVAVVGRKQRPVDQRHQAYLKHLEPWLTTNIQPGFFTAETEVHDLERGYAGTFDLIASEPRRDRLTVFDFKTTAYKAYPPAIDSALLQTAAYAAAWNKRHHALAADAIAAVFISPYKIEVFRREGHELDTLITQFYQRCREFGARINAAIPA
ncbi:MAG: PD-(D/E)XK nuclease family protein [Cyanobacteria bacterium J06659_2]